MQAVQLISFAVNVNIIFDVEIINQVQQNNATEII